MIVVHTVPGGGDVGISDGVVDLSSAGVSLAAGAGGLGAAVVAAGVTFGGTPPENNFSKIHNFSICRENTIIELEIVLISPMPIIFYMINRNGDK